MAPKIVSVRVTNRGRNQAVMWHGGWLCASGPLQSQLQLSACSTNTGWALLTAAVVAELESSHTLLTLTLSSRPTQAKLPNLKEVDVRYTEAWWTLPASDSLLLLMGRKRFLKQREEKQTGEITFGLIPVEQWALGRGGKVAVWGGGVVCVGTEQAWTRILAALWFRNQHNLNWKGEN